MTCTQLQPPLDLSGHRGAQAAAPGYSLVPSLSERWLPSPPHCHKDKDELATVLEVTTVQAPVRP